MTEASGLTASFASLTVLKTGSPRWVVPPFFGVTPVPRIAQHQRSPYARRDTTERLCLVRKVCQRDGNMLTANHVGAVSDGLLTVEGTLKRICESA